VINNKGKGRVRVGADRVDVLDVEASSVKSGVAAGGGCSTSARKSDREAIRFFSAGRCLFCGGHCVGSCKRR
jgi:hypothetical protein